MPDRISKFAIAIEALLLLVPLSALAFWMWTGRLLGRPLGWWMIDPPLLVATISLVCGWILVFRFFVHGSAALRATSSLIWAGAILGGAAVIAAAAINFGAIGLKAALPEYFGLLVVGSPALVPLTHVLLERMLRKSANNRFERSRVASSFGQGGSR
jgi:hypothetical protein